MFGQIDENIKSCDALNVDDWVGENKNDVPDDIDDFIGYLEILL